MEKVKSCFNFVDSNVTQTKFPNDLRCSPSILYNGKTLAMHIFEKWHCDCEEWMRHDVELSNTNGLIAFNVWLINNKSMPPSWTYQNLDPTIQVQSRSCVYDNEQHIRRNVSSNTTRGASPLIEQKLSNYDSVPAMFWIKYTELDIPEFIRVDPHTIDRKGESCMFYWIKYRKGCEIPEFIRHDALYIRNSDKETAAMIWIKVNGTEPPDYLYHNAYAVNDSDENLAIYWLKYGKKPLEVPERMKFTDIRSGLNKQTQTFISMWYQITNNKLPDWISGVNEPLKRLETHETFETPEFINEIKDDTKSEREIIKSAIEKIKTIKDKLGSIMK